VKKALLYLICGLICAALLAGCGGQKEQPKQESKPQASQPAKSDTKITMLGGAAGGAEAIFLEAVAESVRRGNPGWAVTGEPGKDGPNCMVVSEGKAQLALSYLPTAIAAYNGTEPYQKAIPDIRNVMMLEPNYYHFLALKKTGWKSVDDVAKAVKDKKSVRIGVNKKGSVMELVNRTILESHGVTYQDIEKSGGKVSYTNTSESLEMMSTNQLDALGTTVSIPLSLFVEASTRMDLTVLPLNDSAREGLTKKFGAVVTKIPANTYKFQPEEVNTVFIVHNVISSAKVPDEVVYNVVKGVAENLEYMRTANAALKGMDLKSMSAKSDLPYHPGAEKYFKEKGAMK